jgi:hypothetical protein
MQFVSIYHNIDEKTGCIAMKQKNISISKLIIFVSSFVFLTSIVALIFDDYLAATIDVIGIRIAMLIVAFASFCSSTVFGLLIFMHNRTVNKANDDANKRGELFRELQFASNNYSIIEFMDRMLIYDESSRYIEKYIYKNNLDFHMIENKISEEDVMKNPDDYTYISLKIPFRVVEGRVVSSITFDKLKFKRENENFEFGTPKSDHQSDCSQKKRIFHFQ